jgi:uncharacterized Fe-S center protein
MDTAVDFVREDAALFDLLERRLGGLFAAGDRVAVKLHMGEPGNIHYIKPHLTKGIISVLKKTGCDPFIFDSPVVYRSMRNNRAGYLQCAADHGYTESALGVPIVISNAQVKVEGPRMSYHLCAEPLEADGVLLLTHVKGHLASGMGGAIKNVGMGCVSKETKGAIHAGGEPVYNGGCTQCGTCVECCPTDNIRIVDDRPVFDATWCPGCSNCVLSCPEHCITPRVATFDELLAEAAVLAHERFKKRYAVNVLKSISRLCDCVADSGPLITGDIGYACGPDMLSVDVASLDLLEEASQRRDIFAEWNKRSPWGHVRAAAEALRRECTVTIRRVD